MQEYISSDKIEQLNEAISEAMMEKDPDMAVQKLISYYGINTACDRISVFEIRDHDMIDNTYEWCGQGIEPQIRLLQNVSPDKIAPEWSTSFYSHSAVVIEDLEKCRYLSRETCDLMKKQGIQRLVSMPMYMDSRLLGFIGMINPALNEIGEDQETLRLVADFTAALIGRRDADKKLQRLTEQDALTGLSNMTTFRKKVESLLTQGWRTPSNAYVIYFNASNFKEFNALYGPSDGDECLKRIAALIKETFETDVACRNISDHFYAFYQGDDVEARISRFHDRCLTLRKHFKVWMRAGICRTSEASTVFEACDAAKIACDQLPDNDVSFCNRYSSEILKSLQMEKYIQDNAENAIRKGEILVYFQPVVRAQTGKLCSFEALARWNDPKYGFLSPGLFIPVLEKHHRCYKVDAFVIEECCRILADGMKMGKPCVPVSFNISRTDFTMCDPVQIVVNAAQKYGINPRYLCVEITESTIMEEPEKIKTAIDRFKQAGFQVWMDDFGSAYSSLITLKDYDFDEIKLDMAFMRNLNANAKIIVASTIRMARKMGIHTLCEGVETEDQLEFLKKCGCEKIQGYYYGRPMTLEDQIRNLEEKGVKSECREEAIRMDSLIKENAGTESGESDRA